MLDLLDNKEIYDKVDALRLKKGWTIYTLAKQAGVAPTTIYIGGIDCPRLLCLC